MGPLSMHVTEKEKNTWNVPSATDNAIKYTVKLINDTCDCRLRCSTCKVCVHLYSCTCMDSMLHATVCKHVHLVKMMTEKVTETAKKSPNNLEYFSSLLDNDVQDSELVKVCKKVLCKLNEMDILVRNCLQISALKAASKHITSATMVIKSLQESESTNEKKNPPK